ncbi:hypothetical protein KR044_003123, partial [Drosophila immigrans]
ADAAPPPPSRCNFVFDIIVTQHKLRKIDVQDAKNLVVEAQFENKVIRITSSRHNVTEFNPKASLEFSQFPKKLQQILDHCGMPIVVKYAHRVIGMGRVDFPPILIDQIQEGMEDMLHTEKCTISMNGEAIGTVDLLCRLVIKCDDQKDENPHDCGQNINRSINPQDIMFIMGENQRCPNPCEACPDVLAPPDDD